MFVRREGVEIRRRDPVEWEETDGNGGGSDG
jgi:hypothetical protein